MNDNRIVIIGLALLAAVGLLALYAGNNLPPTATTPTATDAPPGTQPTPPPPAP
jgi:hypothetical protein